MNTINEECGIGASEVAWVSDEDRTEPAIVMDPLPRIVQPYGGMVYVQQPLRNGNRGPHAYNIHNEPDVAKRLVRMVEELLERDDALPGADLLWYRNRLGEIKEEMSRGAQPVHDAKAGRPGRPDDETQASAKEIQGNGGPLPR